MEVPIIYAYFFIFFHTILYMCMILNNQVWLAKCTELGGPDGWELPLNHEGLQLVRRASNLPPKVT